MKLGPVLIISTGLAAAEDGLNAWLRYARLPGGPANLPGHIVALNTTFPSPVYTAGVELQKGIEGIFGKQLSISNTASNRTSSFIVDTLDNYLKTFGNFKAPNLQQDGFWLSNKGSNVVILGQNERGALYGAFEYLSLLARANFSEIAYATSPSGAVRWVNQWDNLDGSIERGYGGPSIFFSGGTVVTNLTRAAEYARLLASIRINGVIVNNVNANASLLTPQNIEGLGRIADAFRPYGVQLGISQNFAAPQSFGLSTYDPVDGSVIAWWTNITNQLYHRIPDMAGYLVKADSEGRNHHA
jgi:alpha-glucuronidase